MDVIIHFACHIYLKNKQHRILISATTDRLIKSKRDKYEKCIANQKKLSRVATNYNEMDDRSQASGGIFLERRYLCACKIRYIVPTHIR